MKHLIIIGARGLGREVSEWSKGCIGYGVEFDIKGFLDDKADALEGFGEYPPILGPLEDYSFCEDDVFVVALGNPGYKRKYAELALSKGGVPFTLIHSQATIGAHAVVGKGSIVMANARISVNCKIGDFVTIAAYSVLGHDACVGAYSHLGAFAFMGGFSCCGECVEMHPRASLLPHKKVGENAILGAGCVCIRNVKAGTTVFGVPAKRMDLI